MDPITPATYPKCQTCKHWTQHASDNGDCNSPGLRREEFFAHDYATAESYRFGDRFVLAVPIDHGCLLHSDLQRGQG